MPDVRPNLAAVAAKVIDGEAIIMNLTNGAYYSMVGSGAAIWSLLEQGWAVDRIPEVLARGFEVPPARVRGDLDRLVAELLSEQLVVPGQATSVPDELPPPADDRLSYEAPVLNKYTEMADLLALDPPMPSLGEVTGAPGRAG